MSRSKLLRGLLAGAMAAVLVLLAHLSAHVLGWSRLPHHVPDLVGWTPDRALLSRWFGTVSLVGVGALGGVLLALVAHRLRAGSGLALAGASWLVLGLTDVPAFGWGHFGLSLGWPGMLEIVFYHVAYGILVATILRRTGANPTVQRSRPAKPPPHSGTRTVNGSPCRPGPGTA